MRRLWIHITCILLGALELSCIDQINLDLDTGRSNLVVFGWITNEDKPYEIVISQSIAFSNQSSYPPVTGAEVYVVDQLGNRYDFIEDVNSGHYFSDPGTFVGAPGNAYQLWFEYNGDTYLSAIETMPELTTVDDAFINFIADPADFEIDENDQNFFVSAFIDDDPSVDNYYRWKVYVNGQLRNLPEELVLFDDRFTNGNRFKYDAGNVVFTELDKIYFEHLSLSKGAYDFYLDLKEQTSGSTLSPRIQPGIVEGNITNQNDPSQLILGYFGASEVVSVVVVQ